jgi:FAD:protein FMN transferase
MESVGLTLAQVAVAPVMAAALLSACGAPAPNREGPHVVERAGVAMGSELRLTAWSSDEPQALAAFDEVLREFDRLDALMSVWREGSAVLRINGAAGDRPVPVDAELRDVLHAAIQISGWTHGKFDVTYAALSDLWKFDNQNKDDSVPDRETVRQRLPLINYRSIEIDDRAGTVFLRRKGMRMNLGGIGKGYAVGRALKILRGRGVVDFMIQAGGDMYVAGHRGDRPWRLGINDPRGPQGQSFAELELSDSTFSTSGDYERSFLKNGTRYHHLIDPATGFPATGCRSVTIVAADPMLADGLSTGVFVMGPADGLALVERLPDVGAIIVSAKNEVLVSSRLKETVKILARPTDAP